MPYIHNDQRFSSESTLSQLYLGQSPSANAYQFTKCSGKLSGRLFTLIDGKAVRLASPYLYHILSSSPLLAADSSSLDLLIIMNQSSDSTLQDFFNVALQKYKDKTGTSLVDHPFAERLETCQSVSSITEILQEQAQSFREFRGNNGKLMKALGSSVDMLCSPTISSALSQAIGLVVR